MMKRLFAAVVLLCMLTACGRRDGHSLDGMWKLVLMEGIPASEIGDEENAFTLVFNTADTMVFGHAGCNRFFGRYRLSGCRIRLDGLGVTRMACPDMEYEDAFLKMLEKTDRFAIRGSTMTFYAASVPLAVFRAAKRQRTVE